MSTRVWRLLWLDGGAGLSVGVAVLAVRGWLAGLYGWSVAAVTAVGVANVAYATGSLTLALVARRRPPRRRWIDLLIGANLAWTVVCATLIATTAGPARGWGVAHLAAEGAFVAGLALVERRYLRPRAAP